MTPKGLLRSKAPHLTHSTSIKNNINTTTISEVKSRQQDAFRNLKRSQAQSSKSESQRIWPAPPPAVRPPQQPQVCAAVAGEGGPRANRPAATSIRKDSNNMNITPLADQTPSEVDGVVRRLHTISSRFASAATTPLSRCDK
jgi:hypothetical protein